MIISHKHKFIFIAVPKAGSNTARLLLRPFLDEKIDIEQCALFGQKHSNFAQLKNIAHGHITAMQIKNIIGKKMFKNYFKFAFIRNPYDRFISTYFFFNRNNPHLPRPSTEDFISFFHNFVNRRKLIHILPQTHYLFDEQDLLVDYIGNTMNFNQSIQSIFNTLQLPLNQSINKINTSKHESYLNFCDTKFVNFIKEIYRIDFDNFDFHGS